MTDPVKVEEVLTAGASEYANWPDWKKHYGITGHGYLKGFPMKVDRKAVSGETLYVAAGRGYYGWYNSPREARAVVDRNGNGAVYVREDVHAALLAELSAAREEIERLKGFEPCRQKIGRRETWPCDVQRRFHDGVMSGYAQHKSAAKMVHEFLGGAFGATTEGGS